MALMLARAGAHVLAIARTVGALEALDDEIKALGGSASLIPMDLTEGDGVEQLAGALTKRFDALDFAVLNAAMLGELSPVQDISPKIWTKTLDLNLTVNWRLLRALHPLLKAAMPAKVLFMSSNVGGDVARPYWGAYAVSKAALEMLAQTYAAENEKTGVSVAVIHPGAMRTGMRAQAMPGEDPETLPTPDALEGLFYHALTATWNGALTLRQREWPPQ